MEFNFSGEKPLFQQVADQIAEGIFNGAYLEGEQIPSTTEISKSYQINPATVLKGMNLLVERQLIEKKRGDWHVCFTRRSRESKKCTERRIFK